MIKTVLQEICIMALLCVAILLLFGIAFYDYIPISKTIPNKVKYSVPNDVKTELEAAVVNDTTTGPKNIIYSVTASDLSQYRYEEVYQPGNPNPFQPYFVENNTSAIINGTGTATGTSTGGQTNGSSRNTTSNTSNSSLK